MQKVFRDYYQPVLKQFDINQEIDIGLVFKDSNFTKEPTDALSVFRYLLEQFLSEQNEDEDYMGTTFMFNLSKGAMCTRGHSAFKDCKELWLNTCYRQSVALSLKDFFGRTHF